MSTFKSRFKSQREKLELSQQALAIRAGVSQGLIAQIESGRNSGTKHISALARALNKSVQWLETGEEDGLHQIERPAIKHTPDEVLIPQYNTGGKMGNGLVLRDQAGAIRSMSVNQEWIHKNVPNCTSPKNLAVVTGFGDSMMGIFNSGDPLIVDRGVTSCEYDGIYFFRVGNEGYIKRLQRIPNRGIVVISNNPAYRDWDITPDMDFEVFAKVLRAWKGENY